MTHNETIEKKPLKKGKRARQEERKKRSAYTGPVHLKITTFQKRKENILLEDAQNQIII